MFFGNMQSFYRRNSIHNPSSPQSSKQSKEQIKRRHLGKSRKDESEDYRRCDNFPARRSSFSISRNSECEEPLEVERSNVPVIKVGMYEPETTKKSFNILKEKEKALWYNSAPALDDNSERLGPNKNNIIEETLEIERRRSDFGSTERFPPPAPGENQFS